MKRLERIGRDRSRDVSGEHTGQGGGREPAEPPIVRREGILGGGFEKSPGPPREIPPAPRTRQRRGRAPRRASRERRQAPEARGQAMGTVPVVAEKDLVAAVARERHLHVAANLL